MPTQFVDLEVIKERNSMSGFNGLLQSHNQSQRRHAGKYLTRRWTLSVPRNPKVGVEEKQKTVRKTNESLMRGGRFFFVFFPAFGAE